MHAAHALLRPLPSLRIVSFHTAAGRAESLSPPVHLSFCDLLPPRSPDISLDTLLEHCFPHDLLLYIIPDVPDDPPDTPRRCHHCDSTLIACPRCHIIVCTRCNWPCLCDADLRALTCFEHMPSDDDALSFVSTSPAEPLTAEQLPPKPSTVVSFVVDSGSTLHTHPECTDLVNTRTCKQLFFGSDDQPVTCTIMGDRDHIRELRVAHWGRTPGALVAPRRPNWPRLPGRPY